MDTITIPLTRSQFEAKRAQVGAMEGVTIQSNGDHGIATSTLGVVVDFRFDGRLLTLTVTDKPFLLPDSMIEGRLREWFTA